MTERMTFDELSELYAKEMNSAAISSVRTDLYPAMAGLRTRLRGEYEKQHFIDPDSVMCEGAEHRLRTAVRLCKEVTRIRATKICNMAFLGALGSKSITDSLTLEEYGYYTGVLNLTREQMEVGTVGRNHDPLTESQPESQPEKTKGKPPEPKAKYMPRIRACLEDGRWRPTSYLLRALEVEKGTAECKNVERALGKMVQNGEIERFPAVMPGRHSKLSKIEWRLKPRGEDE